MPTTTISASEFRQNFGKYMALVETQDFQVTRNGRVMAVWSNPNRDKERIAKRLAGSIHADVDLEADIAERRDLL